MEELGLINEEEIALMFECLSKKKLLAETEMLKKRFFSDSK